MGSMMTALAAGGPDKREGSMASPDENGDAGEKHLVVKGLRLATKAAGIEILTEDGKNKISGHLWRFGGCLHLLRRGVSVPSVMAFARWESLTVLRYAKDAPLAGVTGEFKRGLRLKSIDEKLDPNYRQTRSATRPGNS